LAKFAEFTFKRSGSLFPQITYILITADFRSVQWIKTPENVIRTPNYCSVLGNLGP